MVIPSCRSFSPLLLAAGIVLANGCTTESERRAAERAAVAREAANEISRICALPEPEQSAELKRVEAESGVMISCAKNKKP